MTKLDSPNAINISNNQVSANEQKLEFDSLLDQITENVAALQKYNTFLEGSDKEPKDMLGAHFINFHATFSKLMASQQQLETMYPGISDSEDHELSGKAREVHNQLQSAVNLGLKILQEIDVSTYSLKNQMDAIKDVISD